MIDHLCRISRRSFLSAGISLAAIAPATHAWGLRPKTSKSFQLTPAPTIFDLVGAEFPKTAVWAYGETVPGPMIRAVQDDRVKIRVHNGLSELTTVHWHGLRIPNAMDGVPHLTQRPIGVGEYFTYEFDLPDAGTYWYHPHVRATEQQGRGLYGAFIIEEKNPPKVDRDITWVLDDWRLTKEAEIAEPFNHLRDLTHGGRIGNSVTVNGSLLDTLPVRFGERIRLRLINTANARIFGMVFEGHDPQVIAIDGHPVQPHAPKDSMITLGPGQRADVIIDFVSDPAKQHSIHDAYYKRFAYELGPIVYAKQPLRTKSRTSPIALTPNPLAVPNLRNAQHNKIVISGGAMSGMSKAMYKGHLMPLRDLVRAGKAWALNGVAAHGPVMKPMFTFKKNQTYIIRMQNDTQWVHPMHFHGHAFKILTRNGKTEPYTPWADTVLIGPTETVEVALVADNPGDWLYHCHILEHHAAGMSGVIRVEA
jgi:FtsP/CotA-like multicopper oxidase with cupredoxin domain